jgi:hypothetical protein
MKSNIRLCQLIRGLEPAPKIWSLDCRIPAAAGVGRFRLVLRGKHPSIIQLCWASLNEVVGYSTLLSCTPELIDWIEAHWDRGRL